MAIPARGILLFAAAPLLAGALVLAAPRATELQADEAFAKRKSGACPNAHTYPQNLSPDAARQAIRCLLDRKRSGRIAGALASNGRLDLAAQEHTDHMIEHRCFAHECPGEAGMVSRIRVTGYLDGVPSWFVGENIAWGEGQLGSPAEIVRSWMNSPNHRANILDPDFKEVGVGFAHGTPSDPHTDGATFTTDFGSGHA